MPEKPSGGLPMRQVASLCACIIFALAGLSIIAPILPLIQAWQGASYTQMGILVSSFGFARMLMDIPSGLMVDRWERRLVAAAGMATIMAGSLLSARAPSFAWLIAGRVIAGAGSAVAVSAIQTEMLLLADQSNRSTAMSYFMLARRAGGSIYPFAGGLIGGLAGWRAVFYFMVALNLVGILLTLFLPGLRRDEPATAPAGRGTIPEDPAPPPPGRSFFLAVYYLSFVFFLNRNGLEKSTIPLFGASLGLSSLQTGGMLTLSSLLSLLAIAWGGRAADRYGRRPILLLGLVLLLAANAAFLGVDDYATYLGAGLLFGLSAFTMGLPNVVIADRVPVSHTGSALGMTRFFNDLGTVLGPVMLGWAMDRFNFAVSLWFTLTGLALGLVVVYLWLPESAGRPARTDLSAGSGLD